MSRFFRDRRTGRVVVAQRPNLPLALFLVAKVVDLVLRPDGSVGTVLSVVAGLALAWWSIGEIASGASPFRRVLGAVVLLGLVAGRLLA